MTDRERVAREAFLEGYNCSQCIICAFSDMLGIEKNMALRLSSSFGGGMGRMREVCGSVSGMFMVVGMLYGYDAPGDYEGKKELYAIVQELAARYRKEAGSIICRELLGIEGMDKSAVPSPRTKEYYKKRPCTDKIGIAARILEDYIKENPPVRPCI
ncbi:MAG: C_GCAxxG_C_C family protein [Lachnospiraceae bacterium]|nr:C_GCAxxG_C_C family protein [Lachnospiraceae bacterium]